MITFVNRITLLIEPRTRNQEPRQKEQEKEKEDRIQNTEGRGQRILIYKYLITNN